MIGGGRLSTKRAWEKFAAQAEDDQTSAIMGLYSELSELGSEDAVAAGMTAIDMLLEDSQWNEASRIVRAMAISRLENGQATKALSVLDMIADHSLWLHDLEIGLNHYVRGDALAMLNRMPEAGSEYSCSADILQDYPRNRAFALVELASVQADSGEMHPALMHLSIAADIFRDLNEPGMLGFVRGKQGLVLLKLQNLAMSRKILDESMTLLEFADWGPQLDRSSCILSLVHLYAGEPLKADRLLRPLLDGRDQRDGFSTVALARALLLAVGSWEQEVIDQADIPEISTILGATGHLNLSETLESEAVDGLGVDRYLDLLRDATTVS